MAKFTPNAARLTHKLGDIGEKLKPLPKYKPTFTVEVKDQQGTVMAGVAKVLDVRKKESAAMEPAPAQPQSGERMQPTA